MPTMEQFKNGEIAIYCTEEDQFYNFCKMVGDAGLTWQNGVNPKEEAYHETDSEGTENRYIVNDNNVRRYTFYATNYYIMRNGHISKVLRSVCSHNSLRIYNVEDMPNPDEVDGEGFENEIL